MSYAYMDFNLMLTVQIFYHKDTYTWTHLAICNKTKFTALIDSVLDFNPNNGKTSIEFIDKVLNFIKNRDLKVKYILETHAHADHITSAQYIQNNTGGLTVIGEKFTSVQSVFKTVFNLGAQFEADGSQFDLLVRNNDTLNLGECKILALHTPGHTDDSMSYVIEDSVFIGDTLFFPDYGSARCDFS